MPRHQLSPQAELDIEALTALLTDRDHGMASAAEVQVSRGCLDDDHFGVAHG